MLKGKFLTIFLLSLMLSSCQSNKILGSWEFIEVYQGVEIKNIDTLKFKKNISQKGKGILKLNKDKTFTSLDSEGNYGEDGKFLKMKYSEIKDTVTLNISYLDEDYLLLSSVKNTPTTWFYKRIKN